MRNNQPNNQGEMNENYAAKLAVKDPQLLR